MKFLAYLTCTLADVKCVSRLRFVDRTIVCSGNFLIVYAFFAISN
ncbi:hypothetical protein Patl1_21165 [Pistacia atlantica]|uniref:Uncharacterized protein n=1 Tax=Pistacia atlantica TaxID=434234 RepID=A0ACC1BJR7_9ROSI|nr:hypothetical protein Patl1_21165 [Pistacia atlantica]